jgi:hypothetical protein
MSERSPDPVSFGERGILAPYSFLLAAFSEAADRAAIFHFHQLSSSESMIYASEIRRCRQFPFQCQSGGPGRLSAVKGGNMSEAYY